MIGGPVASPLKVAICGGSISGLATALTLSCIGHEVHVFEREANSLFGRGGGVAVLRRMLRFLEAHGQHCRATISVPTRRRRWLAPDGTVQRDEHEMLPFSSWDMVYRSLSSALPLEAIHYSRHITGFSDDGDGIHIQFEDGAAFDADVLIGADGTSSRLRESLFDSATPTYAGYVAWRGLVDESVFDFAAVSGLTENMTLFAQDGGLFMTFLVPSATGSLDIGKRRFNWLWYRNQDTGSELEGYLTDRSGHKHHRSVEPGLLSERSVSALARLAQAALPAQLAQLVLATPYPFLQTISDVLSPSFSSGRVALVGDAACTLRPHTAYGTSKAADDAVTLAEVFSTSDRNVTNILSDWATARRAAVEPLVEKGKKLAANFGLGPGK